MPGFSNGTVYFEQGIDPRGTPPVANQMSNGKLLIGTNASPFVVCNNLTEGYGQTVTNGAGTIGLMPSVYTKYVVDATAGNAPYQTIQAAINQANTDGGGTVLVRPTAGGYTEDLTLYDSVDLVAASSGEYSVTITGTHTPPTGGGYIGIYGFDLRTAATDIFSSAVAGGSQILIKDCRLLANGGYIFNLLNWNNQIRIHNCYDISVTSGLINNTGGSYFEILNSWIGTGFGLFTFTKSNGITQIANTFFYASGTFGGTEQIQINNSRISQTLITADTASGFISNCFFDNGAEIALTHNSTGEIEINNCSINSSAASVITGTGTLNVSSLSFSDNDVIAGTITVNEGPVLQTPELRSNNFERMFFTGFLDWSAAGPYFDDTTLGTFSLLVGGRGYIKGKLITFAGSQDVTGMTAGNTYYIYVDSTGTLQKSDTLSDSIYTDNIPLFECLRDSTPVTNNQVTVKENHPYYFPSEVSLYNHKAIGSLIENITMGANITLNGTQKIEISGADVFSDHGLYTTIPDSAGVGETWRKYYTTAGGKWALQNATDTFTGYYNNAGTPTALGASKFAVYTLYCSKDNLNTTTPVYYAVLDTTEHNNLTAAQTAITNGTTAQSSNELNSLEIAQLGYIIYSEASSSIVDVIISKSTLKQTLSTSGTNQASLVNTDTSNFDGILSAADTNVQAALETIDEISPALTWTEVTDTSQAAAKNNGYICNNVALVTVTLPATAAVGDIVGIMGKGAGLWKLAASAGDTIHFGNQDTSAGGSLTATNRYDAVQVICITADSEWAVLGISQGNLTVA